jgi:hypothetical protein
VHHTGKMDIVSVDANTDLFHCFADGGCRDGFTSIQVTSGRLYSPSR